MTPFDSSKLIASTGLGGLPSSTADIPSASAYSLTSVTLASLAWSATNLNTADAARLFDTNGVQIRGLVAKFAKEITAGRQPSHTDFSEFIQVVWSYGLHLSRSPSDAPAALVMIKPLLDSRQIMERSGAWGLPLVYVTASVGAGQIQSACAELTKAAPVLNKTFAQARNRSGVKFAIEACGTLGEQALERNLVPEAGKIAEMMDCWCHHPADRAYHKEWRGTVKVLKGKYFLGQDDYANAVKCLKEGGDLLKEAPHVVPDLPYILYSAQVLAAHFEFRKQPAKLDAWLDENPIPDQARISPIFRLRAAAMLSIGRTGQALAEIEPALAQRDTLERDLPHEAALMLMVAADIHDGLGETYAAFKMHRDCANLFARCQDLAHEVNSRRKHLEAAWELSVLEKSPIEPEDMQMAAEELLEAAERYQDVSRDIVFGNLAKARALLAQQVAPESLNEVFMRAFSAARALEDSEGALMSCHFEYALALNDIGNHDEAAPHARRAKELLVSSDPNPDTDVLARLEGVIAGIAAARGDRDTFLKSWRRVRQLCKDDDGNGQAPLVARMLESQFGSPDDGVADEDL